jgi:hypothetical protein
VLSTELVNDYHIIKYNTDDEHYKCSCLENEMCKHIQELNSLDDSEALNCPTIIEVNYFEPDDST